MKTIFTLIVIATITMVIGTCEAQKTYTISANISWSNAAYPAYCSGCTFNISSGKTLTIDNKSATCANCLFNGGNIAITQNFTCQSCSFTSDSITMNNMTLNLQSSTTSFSGTNFTITGEGSVNATAPITISNSVFAFSGTTSFSNNGGALTLTKSIMYFYNNAFFLANVGPVNLKSTSSLVAGNGSTSSSAYVKVNGAQLNIYDNSFITLANTNNYYFNWNSYSSLTNNKTYSTATNTMNCGHTGQNKCSAPNVYGAATLNSSGIISGNVLPIILSDFTASISNNQTVDILWQTQQEMNADYFTIERSADGSNWQGISTIIAKGNSSTTSYYSYTDGAPLPGINYYRLQMVDLDGKNISSEVKHVEASSVEQPVSIYPNPFTGLTFNLKVPSSKPIVANVFSMEGRLICTFAMRGQLQYQVKLPANTVHNTYLALQVISNNKTQTFSILNK